MANHYLLEYNKPKPNITDNFYNHINYEWLKTNKIPDDEDKYTHFIETQYDINNK